MSLKKYYAPLFFVFWILFFNIQYFPLSLCPSTWLGSAVGMLVPIGVAIGSVLFAFWMSTFVCAKDPKRRLGYCFALFPVFILVFVLLSAGVQWVFWRNSLRLIQENAVPLIQMIEEFHAVETVWPGRMASLEKDIPSTGVCGYSLFSYEETEHMPKSEDLMERNSGGDPKRIQQYREVQNSGGYEVSVDMSSGILNWDVFIYWPSKNYPSEMRGGQAQRIGDWVYVHD